MNRHDLAAICAAMVMGLWTGAAAAQSNPNQPVASSNDSFAPVTYGEVLAHPDDANVNYRWARTQIARGDLKGASATLERILIISPTQSEIRLLYGVVLYRLGSYAEAAEQLHQLDKVQMDPAARAEADTYLSLSENKMRTTQFTALLAVGAQYDTNRNFAPESAVPGPLVPSTLFSGKPIDDIGSIAVAGFGINQDLGLQGRAALTADATLYDDTQARVTSLDTVAAQVRTGAILRTDYGTLIPNFVATGIWLGTSPQFYYQGFGVDIRGERTLDGFDRRLTVYTDVQAIDEIYHTVAIDPSSATSTGPRFGLDVGANYRIADNLSVTAAWQGTLKHAQQAGRAYSGNNAVLSANWVFAPGQFAQGVLQYGEFPYNGVDPTVDPLHVRRDDILDARVTYGIGVDTLFDTAGPDNCFRGLTVTVSLEEIRDYSTVSVYKNSDFRVLTLLTKKFDF